MKIVVDEDDNSKLRLERVKSSGTELTGAVERKANQHCLWRFEPDRRQFNPDYDH